MTAMLGFWTSNQERTAGGIGITGGHVDCRRVREEGEMDASAALARPTRRVPGG